MEKLCQNIKDLLVESACKEVALQYERYFKQVIQFYGIKAPALKALFTSFFKEHIKPLELEQQFALALKLLESRYAEEKSFGIHILVKNLKKLNGNHIKRLAPVFDNHVYDWGTCDSLAGKVISKIIRANPEYGKLVYPWKDATYLWRQRASCIAFLSVARFGEHNQQILDICHTCIQNPQRFVQLGAGWVLRELSLADLDLVVNFIKTNYNYFSREGLRYAIEKMQNPLRQELMKYRP